MALVVLAEALLVLMVQILQQVVVSQVVAKVELSALAVQRE